MAIEAALLGAVIGCAGFGRSGDPATGADDGDFMREQAEAIAGFDGAAVERMDDGVRVTWDSRAFFDFDSAMLRLDSEERMDKLARVLAEHPGTDVTISVHTDSVGADDYNLRLSERQALSLGEYLVEAGVAPSRVGTRGYGELRPIASNATEEGRRANRRVELEIRRAVAPDDAKRGTR
jgi:outer membrane protein OmpA-like peptidoglycan-associated protein